MERIDITTEAVAMWLAGSSEADPEGPLAAAVRAYCEGGGTMKWIVGIVGCAIWGCLCGHWDLSAAHVVVGAVVWTVCVHFVAWMIGD